MKEKKLYNFWLFLISAVAITIISPTLTDAQIYPFLKKSLSPQANAMGNTYGNVMSSDPMASFFNPAYLGFFSRNHNFGVSFFKQQVYTDITYSYSSFNAGYSFKVKPVTLGIGFHRLFIDDGEAYVIDPYGTEPMETFNIYQKAHVVSTALLMGRYIQIGIGINFKFIESNFTPDDKIMNNAYDYGVSIQIPVLKLLSKIRNRDLGFSLNMRPFLLTGLSYSVTNVGDEITIFEEEDQYALPRMAYLGFNTGFGIEYIRANNIFKIFAFSLSVESEGALVTQDNLQNGQGDPEYLSSIFALDKKFRTHKCGWSLNLLDCFIIRWGLYEYKNADEKFDTKGLGINFVQPVRLIFGYTKQKVNNPILRVLIDSIDIEYHEYEDRLGWSYYNKDKNYSCIVFKLRTIF